MVVVPVLKLLATPVASWRTGSAVRRPCSKVMMMIRSTVHFEMQIGAAVLRSGADNNNNNNVFVVISVGFSTAAYF